MDVFFHVLLRPGIFVHSPFTARFFTSSIKSFWSGDVKSAQKDFLATNEIIEVLFKYGNLQTVMRTALGFMGIDAGYNPSPYNVEISEEMKQALKKELKELKEKIGVKDFGLFKAL